MLENLDRCSPSIVGETANGKSSIGACDLASMSVDELWTFRENIDMILAAKISAELDDLNRQLDRLSPKATSDQGSSRKRSKAIQKLRYGSVLAKYQNPKRPFETWAGRGRRPHWLKEQLISGKPLEDFRIAAPKHQGQPSSL
jgi:DNA-binding protein H-NS